MIAGRWSALVVVPVLVGIAACAGSRTEGTAVDVTPAEIEGMANARRIGGDLLFGGQPSPEALAGFSKEGYRTVVSTRGEAELKWDERAEVEALGLTFVEIPMAYPIEAIRDDWVDRFDEVLREADRPLVIHCSSGNRVAGLWAVWLAERGEIAPERALGLGEAAGMTRIRPAVEKRLAGTGEVAPAP